MTEAVPKMLKKIADLTNSNLIKNGIGILSRKSTDVSV